MKWDVELSLDLLYREGIKEYLELSTNNEIDNSWKKQVEYLIEKYGYLFINLENNIDVTLIDKTKDEIMTDNYSEKNAKELAKTYVKEYAKEYVRGFMKEYFTKKIDEMTKDIKEAEKEALVNINAEADNIAKEIKEFKKKLLRDVSKN